MNTHKKADGKKEAQRKKIAGSAKPLVEDLEKTLSLTLKNETRREGIKRLQKSLNEGKVTPLELAKSAKEHSLDDDSSIIEAIEQVIPVSGLGQEEISFFVEAYAFSQNEYSTAALAALLGRAGGKSAIELLLYESIDMCGDDDEMQKMAILALHLILSDEKCPIHAEAAVEKSLETLAILIASDDLKIVRRAVNGLAAWRTDWNVEGSYNPDVYNYLSRLLEGMLRNPSRPEREILSTAFNGLMEDVPEPFFKRPSDEFEGLDED